MLFNNNKYIVSGRNDNQNRFYIQNSNYSILIFFFLFTFKCLKCRKETPYNRIDHHDVYIIMAKANTVQLPHDQPNP